jgi:hypothetical protein
MLIELLTIGTIYMISFIIGLIINVTFQNYHNRQIERMS